MKANNFVEYIKNPKVYVLDEKKIKTSRKNRNKTFSNKCAIRARRVVLERAKRAITRRCHWHSGVEFRSQNLFLSV